MNPSTSTPNILDSHFSHMTPKESYNRGPLLYDKAGKENMIFIENENQSIKSPTLYKSEVCIFSPSFNSDQAQSHSFIQKINSLRPESYFHNQYQKKKVDSQQKSMKEFEEIPKNLDGFLQMIENQHSQQFLEQKIHKIHFLDYFYRYLIVIIYIQYLLTIICLPYAIMVNSYVIFYVLLLLRFIELILQIKLQFMHEKNKLWLLKRQCLQVIKYEIGQIFGIFGLIFLTNTFTAKWLLTIFVLLCTLPRIKIQELSLKLEFSSWDESFSILLPMLKLCIYIHLLACIWNGFNQDSDGNDTYFDYWDSLFVVTGIISFNNQTTITQKNQKLFFAFVSLSGFFVLAYIIHQTKQYLGPSKQDLQEFKQAFLRVPVPVKLQIVKYCNAPMNSTNKKLILPSSIANKIAFHQGYSVLKFCFPEYEESTLNNCLDLCEQIEAQPEERVLKEGQVDDCSIYFILQGKVKVVDRHCLEVFTNKKSGECFGEYAFYTQNPRSATVISDGSCRLLKLKRMDFLGCLSWKDKQIFQFEQEQMMFSNNYKWQCYCCNSYRHTINKCPQLTYKPKRLQVLHQYAKESINERLNVKRGRIAKHDSAWMIKNQIKVYENKMQYLHNDFYTPTSCLMSNCQLPYEENQRESVVNQSSFQSELQSFNQQLEQQESKIDKVVRNEKNDHSQYSYITAGFGHQFPQKFLVDSKLESINEIHSLEEIDQQHLYKLEKSRAYSQLSNSPDCVDSWAQQRGNLQNQKNRTTIRSLRSKSSKKQSTGTKSNLQSNFTPFSLTENYHPDNFDQVYHYQFYRPQSNLNQILQILQLSQQ